jgi:hypothetical protein
MTGHVPEARGLRPEARFWENAFAFGFVDRATAVGPPPTFTRPVFVSSADSHFANPPRLR